MSTSRLLPALLVAIASVGCTPGDATPRLHEGERQPAATPDESPKVSESAGRRRTAAPKRNVPLDSERGRLWADAVRDAGRSKSARAALRVEMDAAGDDAVDALRWMIAHGDTSQRTFALERLVDTETCPASAVPEVFAATSDENAHARLMATRALALSDTPEASVHVYALAVGADERVAAFAVQGLVPRARSDPRAMELLLRLAREAPDEVQEAAITGIGGLGASGAPAVRILAELLDDDDEAHDWVVIEALAALGDAATPAAPAVLRAMIAHEKAEDAYELSEPGITSCGPSFSIRAMSTLEAMSAGVVPVMVEALAAGEDNDEVRWEIQRTLAEFGEAAVPALREALRSDDVAVRRSAANALGQMDTAPVAAAPDLERLLTDADPHVALSAAAALGTLGEAGWPGLRTAMADAQLAAVAVHALRRQRAAADTFLEPVMRRMEAGDRKFSGAAMDTLRLWGPAAAPAAPLVIPMLVSKEWGVRTEARDALIRMGPGAVDAMVDATTRGEPAVAVATLDTLARMSAPAHAVRPAAESMLSSDDPAAQLVAALYLARTAESAATVVPVLRQAATKLPEDDATETASRIAVALDAYGHADPADLEAVITAFEGAAAIDFPKGYIGWSEEQVVGPIVRVLAAYGARHPQVLVAALSTQNDGVRWRLDDAIVKAGAATAPYLVERAERGGQSGVEAVEILAALAKSDPSVRDSVRGLRETPDTRIRVEAIGVFQSLDEEPADILGMALDLLESEPDGDARERLGAIFAWRIQGGAWPDEERVRAVRDATKSEELRRLLDVCMERIEAR